MSAEQAILEAEAALKMVRQDAILLPAVMICTVVVFSLVLVYVLERWTYYPRRRQRRMFTERF